MFQSLHICLSEIFSPELNLQLRARCQLSLSCLVLKQTFPIVCHRPTQTWHSLEPELLSAPQRFSSFSNVVRATVTVKCFLKDGALNRLLSV